jgi:hypothetical protein
MSDEKRPLPASVSEYMTDRHAATPAEVMDAVNLDEQYREQVEYYCAVTRYFMFGGDEGCDIPPGVRPETVEWADVAEWDVPDPEESSNE